MGESELIFVGMFIAVIIIVGLTFFATAMIEIGMKIKKDKKGVKK